MSGWWGGWRLNGLVGGWVDEGVLGGVGRKSRGKTQKTSQITPNLSKLVPNCLPNVPKTLLWEVWGAIGGQKG